MSTKSPAVSTDSNNGSSTASTVSGHDLNATVTQVITNVTQTGVNATAHPTTSPEGHTTGFTGGIVALMLGLLALGIGLFAFVLYLKKTGRLYKLIPFKPLIRDRRSSNASSHRPLDLEEVEVNDRDHDHDHDNGDQGGDDLPRTREGEMFTIEDFESVDIDTQSRGTNDEYFYDEVFGKSMFEDEATNASMRHLYLATEEDEEMFDVDAIVSSITGNKTKSTKT